MPQVSVIIPTHNRIGLLARALASVVQQSFQDFDVWVIDDGSTDGTREMVLEWIALNGEESRIFYKWVEQGGVSRARNLGAHYSSGTWIAFLDSDDEWLPAKLELQMAELASGGHRLVHGEELWFRGSKQVVVPARYRKRGGRILKDSFEVCAIAPSCAVIERSLFEEMGGFREDFIACEDYDLWLRICSRYEVACVPHPVAIRHGGRADQLSASVPALDYWRVRALGSLLSSATWILPAERALALRVFEAKCEVLLGGLVKRGLDVSEVEQLRGEVRAHMSAVGVLRGGHCVDIDTR